MKDARLILHYLDPARVVSRFVRQINEKMCSPCMQTKVHMAYRRFVYQWGICGLSRKIIWLNVCQINNDPKIIGGYFLDVKANGGCPLK